MTATIAKALAKKVETELNKLRKAELEKAEETFKKDKKFAEYHKVCKEIEKLEKKRKEIVEKFENTPVSKNIILVSGYGKSNLHCSSLNSYVYQETIAADIIAKAAFTNSNITLEAFVKELIEDYK